MWRIRRGWNGTQRWILEGLLDRDARPWTHNTERRRRAYLRRRALVRRLTFRHDLQVSSYGGGGTTLLCSWLGWQRELRTPRVTGLDWAPWKHGRFPPADSPRRSAFRAIYVVADPRDAIASVFRRNYQHGHIKRVEGDVEHWDFTWDLAGYVANGKDLFRLDDHLHQWSDATRRYPILVIRYDRLWDNLDVLARFVGLERERMDSFPERLDRQTDWRRLETAEVSAGLDAMYGPLAAYIETLPPAFVVQNGQRLEPSAFFRTR